MKPAAPKPQEPKAEPARLCDRRSEPVHVSTALCAGLALLNPTPVSPANK